MNNCPFCNGSNLYIKRNAKNKKTFRVICKSCGHKINRWDKDILTAQKSWNDYSIKIKKVF